jgi:hypothetical protein
MSCPYFYPTQSRGGSAWLPLGDWWQGLCHTDPALPAEPADATCCNLGYARGQCARFPANGAAGPDAVRFTIARHDATGIELYYVMERDHHPFAHGPLEYRFEGGFTGHPGGLLEQQALAYVKSFRRRKDAA